MHTDGVGRKLTKIEKRGAKVERTTLHIALQELAEIQNLQEASIKVNLFFHTILDPFSVCLGDGDHGILGRSFVLLVALPCSERRAQSGNGPAHRAHGE
jgi:hypothetical protein